MVNNCTVCNGEANRLSSYERMVCKCKKCGMMTIEYSNKVVHTFELNGDKYSNSEYYNGEVNYSKNGLKINAKQYTHCYILFSIEAKRKNK